MIIPKIELLDLLVEIEKLRLDLLAEIEKATTQAINDTLVIYKNLDVPFQNMLPITIMFEELYLRENPSLCYRNSEGELCFHYECDRVEWRLRYPL